MIKKTEETVPLNARVICATNFSNVHQFLSLGFYPVQLTFLFFSDELIQSQLFEVFRIVQQKSTEYDHGTIVELTAVPEEGYEFIKWKGDFNGTENRIQITVDNPKEVTAVFEVATYPLSIEVFGEGTISISPNQSEYEHGSTIELTASATGDWDFEKWGGDLSGSQNPITITMSSEKSITAVFTNTLFAGGNGTKSYPYQVSSIDQLQAISNYLNSHFVQVNDIDASVTSNWNNGEGFSPIGDDLINFTGSYNGNSYKISSLTINRDNFKIGLFGITGEEVQISNVNLENINFTGGSSSGGLIGINKGGSIINCSVTGSLIPGFDSVGGLIGENYGTVKDSRTSITPLSGPHCVYRRTSRR